MVNNPGFLIYKCRKCSALEKCYYTDKVFVTLLNHTKEYPELPKTTLHVCQKGKFGISDLIGGEEDAQKIET